MKRSFSASVWQEGEYFVAQCVQVDVASQGATEDEAVENLREALELHFTPPVATIIPNVRNIAVPASRFHHLTPVVLTEALPRSLPA